MTSGLNCLLKSRVPPPSFPPYHTSQVKSAPTPVGEPNVRAEAEKSQVSPNARRRAQCKGGGGKEKSIYVHTNDCTIFFLFFFVLRSFFSQKVSKPSPKLWTNSNATASNPPHGQTLFKAAHLQHNRTPNNGSQRPSALASHQAFRAELTASLDPASQAMLQSQSGPYASRTFTTIPFGLDTTYPSHLFRVLLLRRLRLPLPLSARICRCRRILDPLGDHRAACAQAGVRNSRSTPPWYLL